MCGIAGVVSRELGKVDISRLPAMAAALAHRGPDDFGFLLYSDDKVRLGREWPQGATADVALLHQRLSILDLSEAGWQPMASADGRYYVVFNGEIYNYIEIREELVTRGYVFHSSSDTEVLLAAYSEWGKEALCRLIGMFAFAILDTEERRIFLVRDFFGIKPLYYTYNGSHFSFASEIKVLLEQPDVDRRLNPQRVYDYLRYGITSHGSETMFAQIQQLPSAHFLEVSLDDPEPGEPVRFWDLDLTQRSDLSFDDAAKRVRDMFLQNVDLHLRSDVPIGAALSGGIDSSAIVMTIRHLWGDTIDLNTFSYIADDDTISEERWIDAIGHRSGATMHKTWTNTDELQADLERMIFMYDEPLPSTGNYAEFRLSRLTHEKGIKVLMSGQGGDELLGGYLSYIGARLASLLLQRQFYQAYRLLQASRGIPGSGVLQVFMESMGYLLPNDLQGKLRYLVGKELTPAWLDIDTFSSHGATPTVFTEWSGEKEILRSTLYKSLLIRGLAQQLRFEDRRSMAFSIESRVPFLTPGFVQFIMSLPEEYIIDRNATTKAVFRSAMAGIVPEIVLERKDKLGFATPEERWTQLLSPWINEILDHPLGSKQPYVKMKKIKEDWEQMSKGKMGYSRHIWRCCQFIKWSEIYEASF